MIWLIATGLLLAFANGANDNLKGVASLLGSRTADYRRAVIWATLTTLAGSFTALYLAGELLSRFRGKGLVPEELTGDPTFLGAVALGAGATVLLATRIGMPISTTHSLVGALVGTGLAAVGSVQYGVLATKVMAPLLVSPVIALAATSVLYRLFRALRRRFHVAETTCFCVGMKTVEVQPAMSVAMAATRTEELRAELGTEVDCNRTYIGRVIGLEAAPILDRLHFLSGGALGFARGLNDTPKIAAVLMVVPAMTSHLALVCVGVIMALGGLLAARRVAQTMSFEITSMNSGQGFTSNLVSALLVLVASPLGVPVSTTHVTCGSLFGLGITNGEGRKAVMIKILLAWLVTLPLAGGIAHVAYHVLH